MCQHCLRDTRPKKDILNFKTRHIAIFINISLMKQDIIFGFIFSSYYPWSYG